jgi:uncharacterized membrane protein YGL010W
MRIDEQMALYCVFHRDRVNRAIHGVTMPIIMLSGLMLVAPLGIGVILPGPIGALLPLNLGLAIVVVLVGAFAPLDPIAALALGGWMFPSLLIANAIAARLSLPALLAVNAALQGVAWFLAVHVGHERCEPNLLSAEQEGETPSAVSSNLYFERGYFLLRNIGRPVDGLESFQQFAISPFVATLDVLFACGYRPDLRADVQTLVGTYVARLARGEAVLREEAREACAPVGWVALNARER